MDNPRSRYIDIPEDISGGLSGDDDRDAESLTVWVKFSGQKLRDGDCLIVDRDGYRNEGKFLWDDVRKKVIPLAFDLDDYGCIPKEFDLRRFPDPKFFSKILDHNSYIRLENGFIEQITSHAVYSVPPLEGANEKIVWSYFYFGKTRYLVLGIPSDVAYPENQVREERNGELYISVAKREVYEKDSLEYAVNFMRMFIERASKEYITFENTETLEVIPGNILYVNC